jgi:glycerate dehydrogenase
MSDPPRITFLDASTVDNGDLDLRHLRALGEIKVHAISAPEDVAERIAGADIVLTNKTVLDAAALSAAAPTLKLVVVCATGVNNVDLEAARTNGITVCNVVGYSTPAVAQHTISLLLNLATKVHRYAAEADQWPASPIFTRLDHTVVEVEGMTLGLAGAGSIGCRVGEIAEALGMDVQVLARPGSLTAKHPEWPRVSADEFYSSSDIITLHCPLTEATQHMINGKTLRLMKHSAMIINTGRGPLIDETALADALRSNRIAGAALDVLSVEPPPADHPLLDPEVPNLIITPHTAWISQDSRSRLMDGVAHNIRSFVAGTPVNVVN